MTINHHLLFDYALSFDGGDLANNSLYLCVAPDASAELVADIVSGLRQLGLWSAAAIKTIPERHRQTYAEQMTFVACAQFANPLGNFLLARFDHPSFPSNHQRWQHWLAACAQPNQN